MGQYMQIVVISYFVKNLLELGVHFFITTCIYVQNLYSLFLVTNV